MSNETPQEIMTLAELANYLKVAEKTVVRMAREGKIPGTKVASQWRFMRSMVDEWMQDRMQPVTRTNLFQLLPAPTLHIHVLVKVSKGSVSNYCRCQFHSKDYIQAIRFDNMR